MLREYLRGVLQTVENAKEVIRSVEKIYRNEPIRRNPSERDESSRREDPLSQRDNPLSQRDNPLSQRDNPQPRREDPLPEAYVRMRKIAWNRENNLQGEEWIFYEQGKFMEYYEDDYEYAGEFIKYYPTYQDMNDRQLRGYFSWRTAVRRGEIRKTSLSFAFVYIYELLNGIGVRSAEEGFYTLKKFWETYREIDDQIDRYVRTWLLDYVIFYELDPALAGEIYDVSMEQAAITLLHASERSRDELFDAAALLSTYRIRNSKMYKSFPEDVQELLCRVLLRLDEYYGKHRKYTFWENLFGQQTVRPYYIFNAAIFYGRRTGRSFSVRFNEIRRYECTQGRWTCEIPSWNGEKSKSLGQILKTLDSRMREKYKTGFSLKQPECPKYIINIIDREIDAYLAEKAQEARRKQAAETEEKKPEIVLDLSSLQKIREAADKTREKLIVEEEEPYGQSMPVYHSAGNDRNLFSGREEGQDNDAESDPDSGLSGTGGSESELPGAGGSETEVQKTCLSDSEYRYMQYLLYGVPLGNLLRERGILLSVLVDSINEKLFDSFGDTVLEYHGEEPALVEDYIGELREIVKNDAGTAAGD